MINRLKSIALSFAALTALLAPAVAVAAPASALSPIQKSLCSGTNLKLGTSATGCGTSASSTDKVNALLQDIVNIFSAIVGVIAVIMIIVGGLRYITSGGDSSKVGTAKNTLIYAIIGLIIVALAQIIVHFVISKSTSAF